MIKISIVTAIHGRPKELSMFLQNFKKYSEANKRYFHFHLIIAGDENEKTSFNVLENSRVRCHFKQVENRPLGNKFNAALQVAKEIDNDYVIMTGSDDLIHPALFDKYLAKILFNYPDFIGVEDCYFYNIITKEALYWDGYKDERKGQSVGSYRMFSRSLCRKLDYEFYRPDANRGFDKSMMLKLSGIEYKSEIIRSKSCPIVALKGDENIWSFDVFKPLCDYANIDEILKEMI